MRGQWYLFFLFLLGALGLLSIYSPNSTLASNIVSSSISSRSIALTADGSILCVANPDSDSLSLLDVNTSSLLVEIPVGDDPRAVAAGTKFAYVTNHGSDSISIIDLESQTRVADLPIGDRPVGVALSPIEPGSNFILPPF